MDPSPIPLWPGLLLVVLLILMNGFFVAANVAIVKLRGARIDALSRQGRRRAGFVRRLASNPDSYLFACQIGVTLVSLGLGWVGGPMIAAWLETAFQGRMPDSWLRLLAIAVAFSAIAASHIVLGELMPKSLAIRKSEHVTLWTALPLDLFYRLSYPVRWLLHGTANRLLRTIGIEPAAETEPAHSEEEIRMLMQESNRSGIINSTELTLVGNVLDFKDTTAREIMIPRTEMKCLYLNRSFADNMRMVIEEKHTRYPVCETDKDNIIGLVHIKDFLDARGKTELRPFVRPITKVQESMPISQVMKTLQRRRSHMALLIDEYGGTAGLVTFEDIIEEIVGEVHDEFDVERPAIVKHGEDAFSIDGLLLISDVNEYFSVDIDTALYDTIGGWMYSKVESPPRIGQKVLIDGLELEIEETEHLRISRIGVRRIMPEPAYMLGTG